MEDIKNFIEAHKEDLRGMIHFKMIENAMKLLSPEVKPYGVHTHQAWKEVATGLLALAADKEVATITRRAAFRIAGQASANCREILYTKSDRAKIVEFVKGLKRGDAFTYNGLAHIAPDTNSDGVYPVEYGEVLVYDGQYENVIDRLDDPTIEMQTYPLRFQTAHASAAVIVMSTEQVLDNLVSLELNMYELIAGVTPEEAELCDCENCQARRAAEENEDGEDQSIVDKFAEFVQGVIEAIPGGNRGEVEVSVKKVKRTRVGDAETEETTEETKKTLN